MPIASGFIRMVGRVSTGFVLLFFGQSSALMGQVVTVDTAKRAWGTEQVLGEPDTLMAGDIQTAWASVTSDEKREWLILGYEEAVMPKTLAIHETYNPGALDKVTVFDPDGNEVIAWEGKDPTQQGSGKGISVIPLKVRFAVQRVKIYINSPAVSGWNEIDAVALTSATGIVQWAVEAEASTTYATQTAASPQPLVVVNMERLEKLEEEVQSLRKEIDRLKDIEAQLKEIKKLLQENQ